MTIIKAILIDPFQAETREVEFDRGDLSAMYALMGCDLIEIPFRTADAELVIDEEGRCKEDNAAFSWGEAVYVGKALLVGPADSEGNMTSVTEAGTNLSLGFEQRRVEERKARERAEFAERVDAGDPDAVATFKRVLGELFADIRSQSTATEEKTNG